MKVFSVIAVAVIATSFGMAEARAQTLSDTRVPAEFPPASYQGRQYVDSNGCVFIRAGIDGNISWVPRVTRSRKVVCGFQPSLAAAAKVVEPSTPTKVVTPAPKAVVQTIEITAKTNSPKAMRPVAAKSRPRKTAQKSVSKPKVARSTQTTGVTTHTPTACPNRSAVSRQYLTSRKGVVVRCGPQQYSGTAANQWSRGGASETGLAKADVRVAPRHVYESQQASQGGIYIPKGYKAAWEDDRLNPRRTHQTLQGKARMDQKWTNGVPRKLIVRKTGAVGVNPNSVVQSSQEMVVSTRSSTPKKPARSATHRYVQAGYFRDPANAKAAAQRIANTGLPARMGAVKRGGKTYTLVLAGPFQSQTRLTAALQKVRRIGFGDAVLRK